MERFALRIPDPDGKGTININPPGDIPTGGVAKLYEILGTTTSVLFTLAIIFVLFFLIYSGWQWITSAGDKQKLTQVRQRIIYVLIGLIVVFLSYFIINVFTNFFGFKIGVR